MPGIEKIEIRHEPSVPDSPSRKQLKVSSKQTQQQMENQKLKQEVQLRDHIIDEMR